MFNVVTGEIIEGSFPNKKKRLVQAWIEIHNDELMADWNLAISGDKVLK